MHDQPAATTDVRPSTIRYDILLALALAIVLMGSWAFGDWAQVGRLNLTDTDDMMRLAQVRDWLAGQGFNDWTQYRMAPPLGAPMHWSRINDLGIAALILAFTPVLGRHGAEVAAVIGYPGALFAISLFLSGRMARLLWPAAAAVPAIVLASLAAPSIAAFRPGRVDHHALQIVCLQTMILAAMHRPTRNAGLLAGLFVAISLGIGLETVPQIAVVTAALAIRWIVDGEAERTRLAAFAAALGAVTGTLLLVARPHLWVAMYCDTFTPASTLATMLGAAALLSLAGATSVLVTWRSRLAVAVAAGAGVLAVTLIAYPNCVSGPYGQMDPFLHRAMIDHISEARGLLKLSSLTAPVEFGGLLIFGCATALVVAARDPARWRTLLPLLLAIVASTVLMFAQSRVASIGAALVSPVTAGLIVAARARRTWRAAAVLGAWVLSTGISYLVIPEKIAALASPISGGGEANSSKRLAQDCRAGDVWQQIDRYPPGIAFAAIDVSPYLIGGTRFAAVGSAYHRNNLGNRALYAFFLADPATARRIAAAWHARYVAFCPGDFTELGVPDAYRDSVAARLTQARAPAWLQPLPLRNTPLKLYRIR